MARSREETARGEMMMRASFSNCSSDSRNGRNLFAKTNARYDLRREFCAKRCVDEEEEEEGKGKDEEDVNAALVRSREQKALLRRFFYTRAELWWTKYLDACANW